MHVGAEIGRGAHGAVHEGELSDGTTCVIKSIPLHSLSSSEAAQSQVEASVLSKLEHPHVVQCLAVEQLNGELRIAQERCDGGDLCQYLQHRNGRQLPEEEVMAIFVQVLLALHAVHSQHTLHRDIKSSNVFLCADGTVKLGDFGISRILDSSQNLASTVVGTPFYLSPEVIKAKAYGFKSDLWSLGAVLYELCMLQPPFDGANLPALAMKILKGAYAPINSSYSAELRGIVGSLLQQKPERRPSTSEMLATPFVRSFAEAYAQTAVELLGKPAVQLPDKLPRQPPNARRSKYDFRARPKKYVGGRGKHERSAKAAAVRGGSQVPSAEQHRTLQQPKEENAASESPSAAVARHRANLKHAKPRVTREEIRKWQRQQKHVESAGDASGNASLKRDVICAPGPHGVQRIPIGSRVDQDPEEDPSCTTAKCTESVSAHGGSLREHSDEKSDCMNNGEAPVDGFADVTPVEELGDSVEEGPDEQEVNALEIRTEEEEEDSDEPTAADVERLRARLEAELGDTILVQAYREVREARERGETAGEVGALREHEQLRAGDIFKLVLLEDAVFGV